MSWAELGPTSNKFIESLQENKNNKRNRGNFDEEILIVSWAELGPTSNKFHESLQRSHHELLRDKLCDAARTGNLERVRLLLEQGADKERSNYSGYTPLISASWYGHLDVVQYLVEQGSKLDEADCVGFTPLFASLRHFEVTRYLLEQGADRDKVDDRGKTLLHWAAEHGHLETAKLLMVYGADFNARDIFNRLPIDMRGRNTEEIRQAIRDEPRRRMDHGYKRATEQDRHPNKAASASLRQNEEDGEEELCNKRPRLDEGKAEDGVIADEDQDSETSSDEEDD